MPNRIIKESIHTSEDVNRMTDFQFRLWISLITYVDDYGRGDARPAIIKGACFPLRDRITNKDIDAALRDLAGIGCVGLYEVDGKPYLYFPTWESHQRIQTKKSRFPAPPHGEPPSLTVNCGESPPESNPNPNPNPNTNPKESAPPRHAHGQYGWVKLTDDEYARLLADLGEAELARCIAYVDESAQSTGNKNKWKDWNLTVRKCHRDGWGLNRKYTQPAPVATADRLAEMIRRGDFGD